MTQIKTIDLTFDEQIIVRQALGARIHQMRCHKVRLRAAARVLSQREIEYNIGKVQGIMEHHDAELAKASDIVRRLTN